jgi:nucleoside-diphosphate-sugar epimerase
MLAMTGIADMLTDRKILVTGAAGQIGFPLAAALARDNEVWGAARFSEAGSRQRCEKAGMTTCVVDLATANFSELPDDFTHVLHLAAFISNNPDYDAAVRTNAEGTGLLISHCRRAKAIMVMSTAGVYKPEDNPWHAFQEHDALGDANLPASPTYSVSKIGQEAAARAMCRALDVPVVIARMNVAYGANGGLPAFYLDRVVAAQTVSPRFDPSPYSPIHEDDIYSHTEAMLDTASVPATVVNWGGDDPSTVQEWCGLFGELAGMTPDVRTVPVPGTHPGQVFDTTRRFAITGPCLVVWKEGMTRMFRDRYPDGIKSGPRGGRAAHAMQSLTPD